MILERRPSLSFAARWRSVRRRWDRIILESEQACGG
jgi:hypothetical protein